MKKKYVERPAEYLMLDCISIIAKYQTKEASKPYLIKKIGLNDKQIDFLFDEDEAEVYEDNDAFRDVLLKLEQYDKPSKEQVDLRFLKKRMISNISLGVLFLSITIMMTLIGFLDSEGRDPGNIQMIQYMGIPLMLLVTLYAVSLEFIYSKLYFRFKKDIQSQKKHKKTLNHIIKIKPLYDIRNKNRYTVGLAIINVENQKKVKYYLLAPSLYIRKNINRNVFNREALEITYYQNSKIISSKNYKQIIKKAQR